MADVRFNLTAPATPIFPGGVLLSQSRVHQQLDYDEVNQLIYVTQVIDNGVTLPGESEPPANGVRGSRGDLAINRVNLAGDVTGVMYCRSFDHGSGIGVEVEGGVTYIWIAYDAVLRPIGTNAHGRRIARLPFQDGAVIDPDDPSIDDYNPIPNATSITPGLDLANNQFVIAGSPGGTGTRYRVFDLAAFKAKDFSSPLADFPRPAFPDYQSWQVFNGFIYQMHGSGYNTTDNPPPPGGTGNAWFTVIDTLTGQVVQRVKNDHFLDLPYREAEGISFWNRPGGPELVFGFATSTTAPRRMNLFSISDTVQPGITVTAVAVGGEDPGVQLTVGVVDALTVQTWQIYRVVSGVRQLLFSGTGPTLADGSVWLDEAPPGCIPLTYVVETQHTTGDAYEAESAAITYVPPGGCQQGGQAVGDSPTDLGCAAVYSAVIHWRGGAQPYPSASMTRLTDVTWGRTINDVSEAQITVLKGNVSPDCCEALGKVEPWVHELTVYRDAQLVWQGPVIATNAKRESITITGRDVFSWFDKLVNRKVVRYVGGTPDAEGKRAGTITYIAHNHIRLNLQDTPLSTPADYPSILPYIVRRDTGLPTINVEKDGSSNTAVWAEYLGNILREWTKRGLTFTTVGRSLVLRGRPTNATRAIARLTLDDFSGEIEVIKDGSNAATYGWASNQDQQNISTGTVVGTGRTGTAYGRLDVLVNVQDEGTTVSDLRQAAREAVAGRYPVPLTITVPDGSGLTATAPVMIEQLVPGERIDVLADAFCTPIVQGFMLSDVDVTWQQGSEKVAISLIPLAEVDEELSG